MPSDDGDDGDDDDNTVRYIYISTWINAQKRNGYTHSHIRWWRQMGCKRKWSARMNERERMNFYQCTDHFISMHVRMLTGISEDDCVCVHVLASAPMLCGNSGDSIFILAIQSESTHNTKNHTHSRTHACTHINNIIIVIIEPIDIFQTRNGCKCK